jgi:hypothetical protein
VPAFNSGAGINIDGLLALASPLTSAIKTMTISETRIDAFIIVLGRVRLRATIDLLEFSR